MYVGDVFYFCWITPEVIVQLVPVAIGVWIIIVNNLWQTNFYNSSVLSFIQHSRSQ